MEYYKKLIDKMEHLPTLPKIYTALMKVTSDPNSTVDDVVNLISQDQASSVEVLKTVNSSFYGFENDITTIKGAVMHLGFKEVKNIVMALSMIKMFPETGKESVFSVDGLWRHSLATGVAARLLGKKIGLENMENLFLAGIVHDLGKLFFLQQFEDEYIEAVTKAKNNRISIESAEMDMFGIDHTTAGDLMAEKWKLPSAVRTSIKYHSSGLADGEYNPELACLHIANILARALELGNPGDNLVHRPNEEVVKRMGLPDKALTELSKRLAINYENASMILLGRG